MTGREESAADDPLVARVTGALIAFGSHAGARANPVDAAEKIIAMVRDRAAEAATHPEDYCHRCLGPNVLWVAPSPLWNQVMRGGDIDGVEAFDGIVCPTCFAVLAEAAGVAERWKFYADRVSVPLREVTPGGRVWNPVRWMWEEPGAARYPNAWCPDLDVHDPHPWGVPVHWCGGVTS